MEDLLSAITPETIEGIGGTIAGAIVAIGAAIGRIRRAVVTACKRAAGRGGPLAAVLLLAFSVSGCGALAVAGGVIATSAGAYCAGVSDAAKHVVRDTITAGQKVIACEEGGDDG